MKLNETFLAVKLASRKLALMEEKLINEVLNAVADAAIRDKDIILAANSADLQVEAFRMLYHRLVELPIFAIATYFYNKTAWISFI